MGNDLGKKTVFLIDDDLIFQDIVDSILSDKYNIITAKSGEEALILLIKKIPDLILLDIVMPEMSGWEAFHKIRGISTLCQVPIAFVTSVNKSDAFDQAKILGASEYFTKPLDEIDFLNRIENIFLAKDEPAATGL